MRRSTSLPTGRPRAGAHALGVALTVFAASSMYLGCGDGVGTAGTMPNASPGRDRFAGGGTDRALGGGTDRGGGTTPAFGGGASSSDDDSPTTPPTGGVAGQSCNPQVSTSCGEGAICASSGFCVVRCTLASATENVGTDAVCPSGFLCVRVSAGVVPVCLLPCTTAATCPQLAGLTAICGISNAGRYCSWTRPQS